MNHEKLQSTLQRENLQLASFSKRIKAFVVDDIVLSLVLVVGFSDRFTHVQTVQEFEQVINSLTIIVMGLHIAYQWLFIYLYGATLGKIWQKIIVVNEDDLSKPNLMTALLRSMGRAFSMIIFYIGFLVGFYDLSRQTLHDKIGKTIVIDA